MAHTVADATKQILVEDQVSVLSKRDLVSFLHHLYAGDYSTRVDVRTRRGEPSDTAISQAIFRLMEARVVRPDPDFGAGFYQVFDVLDQHAESVCCQVDPLCYVSHLSAMQLHGLTERSPKDLVLTRPAESLWREMLREQHPELDGDARPISKRHFPAVVRERSVLLHDAMHPGTWEQSGPRIRIASVGQVFLDMVTRPAWCGGMAHVLEVWSRDAGRYFTEIITAIGAYPSKLPKVRAGYILDEILGIADDHVLNWRAFAQRGSSQKLDPEQPYAPTFSENWMLSINV